MSLPNRIEELFRQDASHDKVEPDPIWLPLRPQVRVGPRLAPPAFLDSPEAGSRLIAGTDERKHALK
jgi:hypothetical protein